MNIKLAQALKQKLTGLKEFLIKAIWIDKLNNPFGFALLLASSVFFSLVIIKLGFIIGVLLLLVFIAIPSIYATVAYPKFGIIVLFLIASSIFIFIRIGSSFPLGTLVDAFQALLILGFLIKQKIKPNWTIYKNPISVIIIIWILYNIMQLANPVAESRLAWVYTIRSVAMVMLMYFVYLYNIDSKSFIRLMIKLWLGISLFVALYACKQEFVGFFEFEQRGLESEKVRSLLFIGGHWRKFSIYSDPVTYSYNMVISALLCFGLLWGPYSIKRKIILGFLCLFFLYVMLFSGTRGAYVLFPASAILFSILNFSKRVFIFSAVTGLILGFLIVVPTSNSYLYRFQTAFKPSEDASFIVRKMNQARIKPYIQSHPIGGGLGAVGVWGIRFAPNSYLAKFPPDSGYARVAVELGWIGLLLICTLMFIVLSSGINYFFKIKDPELKNYCMTMTLIVFALNVGNYPQEALVQFPTPFFFYLTIAIINGSYILDLKQSGNEEKEKKFLL